MSVAANAKPTNPQNKRQQQMIILGVIAAVAVIAVVVAVALSGQVSSSDTDYASIPHSRTADGGFVLGNPDAPVTIVEFADYACPACQQYEPTVARFVQEFVLTGQARYEYRMFATAGGQYSEFVGQIEDCIARENPDAFWTSRDQFFRLAQQGRYQDAPRLVAQELGLNYSDLLSCAQASERTRIDMALGQRVGITGTPAVAIRYGDSEPQFITYSGQVYNRGGVPFDVLAAVVNAANQ